MHGPQSKLFSSLLLGSALASGCQIADPDDELMPLGETTQAIAGGFRLDAKTAFLEGGLNYDRHHDIDGDGKAELFAINPTSSPNAQLAAIGAKSGVVTAALAWPLAGVVNGVPFTTGVFEPSSDLTGDARADFLHMDSARGLRVVQRNSDGSLRGGPYHPYGNFVNEWLLRDSDTYQGTADVDGDGIQELVMSSTWGFVVFDVSSTGALSVFNMAQRGRYLEGGRAYIDNVTQVMNAGRFWGGNEELLLMRSSTGFSLAYVPPRSSSYTSFIAIEFAPWGQMQDGGWRIGSDNFVHGVGDVNGDGRDDFVLSSPWGVGVLTSGDWLYGTTAFRTVTAFAWGTPVDGRAVNGFRSSHFDAVDDFDGDGRADILIQDAANERVILLSYDAATNTLKKKAALGKGQVARGGWNYDGHTDIRRAVGRFGDSARASVLERSAWGVGMLGADALGFFVVAMTPYDATPTWCGDYTCNGSESCSSCAVDCGECPVETCGNGVCGAGESCSSCETDCGRCPSGSTCGNLVCEAGETCSSCASDCGTPYQFCQFCPNGAGYYKTNVTKNACSEEAAAQAAEDGKTCSTGFIGPGVCPKDY